VISLEAVAIVTQWSGSEAYLSGFLQCFDGL